MNKHLRIEVNGMEWVNGDFSEVTFTDGPGGVKVEAKAARQPARNGNGGGANLLEMLTGASRARTQAVVEEKRASLAEEATVVEVVEADPVP